MPLFNINLRTPSHIADTLTVERADHHALRIEVARFVGELLKDHAELLWSDEQWQVDVSDTCGLILYVVDVSVAQSPATDPRQRAGMPTNDR